MAFYKKEPTAYTENGGKPVKKANDWEKKPKKDLQEETEITEDIVGDEGDDIETEDVEIQ